MPPRLDAPKPYGQTPKTAMHNANTRFENATTRCARQLGVLGIRAPTSQPTNPIITGRSCHTFSHTLTTPHSRMRRRPRQELVTIAGAMPEVCISLGGRQPASPWWPSDALEAEAAVDAACARPPAAPASAAAPPPKPREASGRSCEFSTPEGALEEVDVAALVTDAELSSLRLEDDVPIALVRLRAARVSVSYSADRLSVSAAMQSMAVDDLLVGAREPALRVLARSWAPGEDPADGDDGSGGDDDDVFEDAQEEVSAPGAVDEPPADASAAAQAQAADGKTGGPRELVSVSFVSYSVTSPKYAGLDSEICMTLSALHVFAHRPTLSALMAVGGDMGAAGALLAAQQRRQEADGGGCGGAAGADADALVGQAPHRSDEDAGAGAGTGVDGALESESGGGGGEGGMGGG
eukprot:345195-Chlamydomonas_euryale.AAC.1